MKLKFIVTILVILLALAGCSESSTNKQESNVTTSDTEVVIEETEEAATDVKKSYAEKHPELDPQIVEMFELDSEYSENTSDFFDKSEENTLSVMLQAGEPNVGQDFIDFFAGVNDDKGESVKKKVMRVWVSDGAGFVDGTSDHYRLDGANITYKVLPNETVELNSINEDKIHWNASDYDVSNDSHDYFRELAGDFNKVLVYTEGMVGRKEYILYKYIPLGGGYKLEVQLIGDKNSFEEGFEDIYMRLDNITINPLLLEQ